MERGIQEMESWTTKEISETYVRRHQKKLRRGITTGTCAAAAARAAAALLLSGVRMDRVELRTPKGMVVSVPTECIMEAPGKAGFRVRKDSGDDPDVTCGAWICASVEIAEHPEKLAEDAKVFKDERYPNLWLDGGAGVGRVTKGGLEQHPGQAAINRVPRAMIFSAVGEWRKKAEAREALFIQIKVPEGETLAKRTFNSRLGILGGISILGTSGILEPMSEKAIVDTIEAEIRQRKQLGERQLLTAPGNYGQAYLSQYLGLSMEQSVKCSNFIGETLDLAASYGMESFLLVGNIGKLVKLAAGIMNTHSNMADGRQEIMAAHTALCGGSQAMARRLIECVNTEEMLMLLDGWGLRDAVIKGLCEKIHFHLNRRGGGMKCGAILFSEGYGCLGQTAYAAELLEKLRKEKRNGTGT